MFTLPLYDDNPTRRTPFLTWAIIVACIVAFLWQATLPPGLAEQVVFALGVIPAVLLGRAELAPEIALVPPWATVLTSMFLHGGLLHLAGNMLFLWIFGNNVEDSMGHVKYLLFYLLCGTAAALTQAVSAPGAEIPMIGASGAIGGVLGAYLLLHPRANVRVLLIIFFYIRIINVPAVIVLGIWFVVQFLSGWTTAPDQGGVAFWAHVGGFVAGAVLIPVFKDRDVPLFAPPHSKAFEAAPPRRRGGGSVPTVPLRRDDSGVDDRDGQRRGPWA